MCNAHGRPFGRIGSQYEWSVECIAAEHRHPVTWREKGRENERVESSSEKFQHADVHPQQVVPLEREVPIVTMHVATEAGNGAVGSGVGIHIECEVYRVER